MGIIAFFHIFFKPQAISYIKWYIFSIWTSLSRELICIMPVSEAIYLSKERIILQKIKQHVYPKIMIDSYRYLKKTSYPKTFSVWCENIQP